MQYSSLVFGTNTSKIRAKYKSFSPYGPTNPCPASDMKSNLLGLNLGHKKTNIDLNF
jgi:hypothetical protein